MATAIAEFNQWLNVNRKCADCPMSGRGVFVGGDTATGLATPQQILFLGLNPGVEEARQGLPFVGPSGRFLRLQLQKTGITSWGMANSLLCSSRNEHEIVAADKARACCHDNLAQIFLMLQPRLIVPCGNGAWSLFRARLPITAAAGQIFLSRGPSAQAAPVLVLPILHPSALIRSGGEASAKFPAFFARLKEIAALATSAHKAGVEATAKELEASGTSVRPCFS